MSGLTFDHQVRGPNGRVARLLKAGKTDAETVDELFLATPSRLPTAEERRRMLAHFAARPGNRAATAEDISHALLTGAEFLFQH